MQLKTRITKAPDERRKELISAARQLFFTQGYDSTSVRDIVVAIGVAKGTFYYYFDTKEEILEAVVDEITEQTIAVMHAIVTNPDLSAIEKWQQAFQATASWKIEHRTEMVALLQMLNRPENLRLRVKIEEQAVAAATPEIAQIIAQGVREGVFETEYVEESAEITFSIMRSSSKFMGGLILEPERYADPLSLARHKVAALQSAVERLLGAPPNSLPMTDADTLAAWFPESQGVD